VLERLVRVCHQVPKVAAAIDDYHGLEVISEAIKAAGERQRAAESNSVLNEPRAPRPPVTIGSVLELPPELQDPIKSGELKIVTYDFTEQTKLPHGYTEEDTEKLQNDLVLITDKRDSQKTAIPYDVKTEKAFVNPTDTGIYEVLTRAGKFERCLVLVKPQGPRVRETLVTVIRLSEPRNWRNIGSRSLWVVNQETTLQDSTKWDKWWDQLPEGSLSVGKRRYVIVGPRGDCTLPFRVRKDLATEFGSDVYEVDFDSYCPGPYDFPLQGPDYGPRGHNDMDWGDCCDTRHAYRQISEANSRGAGPAMSTCSSTIANASGDQSS